MVQAMWKLLFQQAVERRADKGKTTARPAFLWEDEGHMFFSQHDVDFQPTARDCRAPHVILSQNLHNFYQQGHNPHAVEAVFSAMNTLFFHTNGDMTTNKWASEKIGEIRKLKLTTDGLLRPMQDKDYTFLERQTRRGQKCRQDEHNRGKEIRPAAGGFRQAQEGRGRHVRSRPALAVAPVRRQWQPEFLRRDFRAGTKINQQPTERNYG